MTASWICIQSEKEWWSHSLDDFLQRRFDISQACCYEILCLYPRLRSRLSQIGSHFFVLGVWLQWKLPMKWHWHSVIHLTISSLLTHTIKFLQPVECFVQDREISAKGYSFRIELLSHYKSWVKLHLACLCRCSWPYYSAWIYCFCQPGYAQTYSSFWSYFTTAAGLM